MKPEELAEEWKLLRAKIHEEATKDSTRILSMPDISRYAIANGVTGLDEKQLYNEVHRTRTAFNLGKKERGHLRYNAFEFTFICTLIRERTSLVSIKQWEK